MCWEVRVRMANLQTSSPGIFPTWVASSVVRTMKSDQPRVTEGQLKDTQQLFPFLLRPGEEMGSPWRGDLDWHMKGCLAEGKVFSQTAQSHLLLLLFKNIKSGVFCQPVRDQKSPESQGPTDDSF